MNRIIVCCLFLLGCSQTADKVKNTDTDSGTHNAPVIRTGSAPAVCDVDYDTTLVRLAKAFKATDIDLWHSMPEELNQFMIKVDTNCLRKQKQYPFFISTILAKLVLYQLTCCHQHYELRATSKGGPLGATVIVNEFEWMAGFQNKVTDMLNSGEVEKYILKTPQLESNPYLKRIMLKIKKAEDNISKGVYWPQSS
jgi:hypothetical protein